MEGKLLRFGLIIVTLALGMFLISSLYRNFTHLVTPPAGQASQPVTSSAPAPQP
ncbi:hypothetical protein OQ252_02190 [Acetobacter farinalis]|uniref:Uncharacterized protein n=1 Tax=Acetobacter farinalis TaxID=1260984 RepID=A0ABT3Q4M5_9PROT|nr:hypothetical protein [Acetobacter farinalis]MCX2560217.1 hypothetical protein [Acetobacter farinalis]NHO28873.1 hypothetical protein [Acetobacter farinalis]